MKHRGTLVLLMLLVLVLAVSIQASNNPKLLSYQGRLLNSAGNPVPNGTYSARFSFYNSLTLGTMLWQEVTTITTSSGDFTCLLGSVTPIPDSLFPMIANIYLQVQIGSEVLSPRVRVTSAGYSLQVHTIDQAKGGTVSDSIVLVGSTGAITESPGAPLTISSIAMRATGLSSSSSYYEPLDSKNASALNSQGSAAVGSLRTVVGTNGLQLYGATGEAPHTSLIPDWDGYGGGLLFMANGQAGAFVVDANKLATGHPRMEMSGNSWMMLDADYTGDNSVQLPSNAINSFELLNEPGIANSTAMTGLTLTTTMQDLTTVSIAIPADGYIFLTGKVAEALLYNTTGSNYAYLQIDETAGGSVNAPGYAATGAVQFPNSNNFYYSLSTQRVYQKSAGTYTFRLEGCRGGTGTGATGGMWYPTLTAIYIPSAYGGVAAVASGSDLGQFQQVTTVPAGVTPGTGVSYPETHIVDLRELELKAAKAQAEAERLQRQVLQEKLKQLEQVK